MRKLLMIAALALVPVVSQAQFGVGLRVGYAPALGNAYEVNGDSAKMSDGVKSQIPIQLDALYKVTPEVAVGAYVSYGFGNIAKDRAFGGDCTVDGVDCSASDLRLGVQALYTFNNAPPELSPWLGLGLGYEWATGTVKADGSETKLKLSGFELLNLQAGLDYKVNEAFVVGPYAMFSLGQYGDPSVEVDGVSVDFPTDSAMHSWFNFGIRGKFDL